MGKGSALSFTLSPFLFFLLRVTNAWWWPLEKWYWPEGVAREETIPAFVAAFATLGYTPGNTPDLEGGVEKVALYAVAETPAHVARQLPDGRWTSKLGPNIDIEHDRPEDVGGGAYGEVVAILSRKTSAG